MSETILYRVTFTNMEGEYDFGSLEAIAVFEEHYYAERTTVIELPFPDDEEILP